MDAKWNNISSKNPTAFGWMWAARQRKSHLPHFTFAEEERRGLKKFPILCQRRVLDSNSGETSIGFFGCQQVLRSQFSLQRGNSYQIIPEKIKILTQILTNLKKK